MVLATGLLGQRHGLDAGGLVADAAVADAVEILGDALHHRGRAGLLLDVVAVVALAERDLLEVAVGAGGRVAAVQADRPFRPRSVEAGGSPGVDGALGAALEGVREDRVDLGHGQLGQRVVLVDVDRQRVDRDADLRRLVAERLLELVDLAGLHRAAHRADLGRALDQRRRRGRGALALDLDPHVRVQASEALRPEGHQVVERVGADRVEATGDAAGPFVGRDRGVHLDGLGQDGSGDQHEQPEGHPEAGGQARHAGSSNKPRRGSVHGQACPTRIGALRHEPDVTFVLIPCKKASASRSR